jgi:hypothetical protein
MTGSRPSPFALCVPGLDAAAATTSRTIAALGKVLEVVEATQGGGGTAIAFQAGRQLLAWRDDPGVSAVHDRLFTLMATQ